MQDAEIIELYFARNEQAISATDEKYGAYCTTIAYNILHDGFDSEECVNDTYMRVWNTVPPTRPNIFSAFLAKITRNLAIDRYKAAAAKKRISGTESLDEIAECLGGRDISEELELKALGALISRFLLKESELARRIFTRKYFFEDTVSDIAKAHGISESYVKTLLHRERKRLLVYLEKEGIFI